MKGIRFWQSVFVKNEGWQRKVEMVLDSFGIELLNYDFQPLGGGLRKVCFRVKAKQGDLVLAFWPQGSLSKKKIIASLELEDWVGRKGVLPTREWVRLGNEGIVKIKVGGYQFWLGVLGYLPGKPIWNLEKKHIERIGEALGRLHRGKALLHLDFARGNLLFNQKGELCGVLDFEESRWGEAEEDLGCTLSFLVADNLQFDRAKIQRIFLKGYKKKGNVLDYDKISRYFGKFLEKRMAEKKMTREAVIRKARRRLDDSRGKIKAKILTTNDLIAFAKKNKKKKIVLVVGAFGLLHWGHFEFLKRAKIQGDLLVVGVASDESRRRLKGPPHPIVSSRTKAETLAFFDSVDGVVVVDEDDVTQELTKLKPGIFFTVTKDWTEGIRKPEEAKLMKSWHGKVVKTKYFSPGMSSSQMVEKVALLKIKQILLGRIRRQPILKFRKGKKITQEVEFKDLGKLGEKLRRQGKTVVFASLTADLFHLGHARFILKAHSLGDVLVVGVPSNRSVTASKGIGRPMVDEKTRALVLAELSFVDRVVIFDERTILKSLEKLKPDIFFTVKESWNKNFLNSPEARLMKSIGGKIVRSERQAPYLSASKMIDKAAGELIDKKFSSLLKIAKETPVLDADGFDPHGPEVQLAAREKGFYDQVLAAVAKRGKCVFCDLKEKYFVIEKNNMVLTIALFPYTDGHLLIIPRRHVESLDELNQKEWQTVLDLTKKGKQVLEKKLGVKDVWFLLREGRGIKAGKTVDHLHFHLIPYQPEVIKMGETKLKTTPLKAAERLCSK